MLGGVSVRGAAAANLPHAGDSKLSGAELAAFLSPGNMTPEDNRLRQEALVEWLFENLKNKNIALTMELVQRLLNSMESNIDAVTAMGYYAQFTTGGKWTRRDVPLPTEETREQGRLYYQPDLDRCRTLMEND